MNNLDKVTAGRHQCGKHGLPTAAAVRSSQATPARHRGQACGCAQQTKTSAFGAALPTPPPCVGGVDNTIHFKLIVAD